MRRALLLLASVAALGMPAVAAHAQAAPIALQASSESYAALVAEAAERFGIPAAWIRAIMHVESRGDRRAISPGCDGVDAAHARDLGCASRSLRPRTRRVRSSRQHPGGRGFPARDARPLRITGIPRGVQRRAWPIRGLSRPPSSRCLRKPSLTLRRLSLLSGTARPMGLSSWRPPIRRLDTGAAFHRAIGKR